MGMFSYEMVYVAATYMTADSWSSATVLLKTNIMLIRQVKSQNPIYKISDDLSFDYRKYIVR